MFQINGIPCVFSKVFDVETRVADVVEAFVDEHDGNCVVHFIDVAATPAVVSIVENVVKAGGHVSYWDHHVPTPPRTPRDQRPALFQVAWEAWASDFVAAAQGDSAAEEGLIFRAREYAKAVAIAEGLPLEVRVDGRLVYCALPPGSERIDLGTLARRMEKPPAVVTAIEKTLGPIVSAGHERQISIAVVKEWQSQIISNVPFLLHVSPVVWMSQVYPWLMKKLLERDVSALPR
jgi:hypothetical protein